MDAPVDALLAVVAMLVSIRPLMRGALGSRSHVSWRRGGFLVAGGLSAWIGVVGLLALRAQFLGEAFYLPTWLGGTLAFFGGMLGASTVLAGRGPQGMSESQALRLATQAAAMTIYLAAPLLALGGLGGTRLLRACLPFTYVRTRWMGVAEGVTLLLLCLVPRDGDLGGLRRVAPVFGAPVAEQPAVTTPG